MKELEKNEIESTILKMVKHYEETHKDFIISAITYLRDYTSTTEDIKSVKLHVELR